MPVVFSHVLFLYENKLQPDSALKGTTCSPIQDIGVTHSAFTLEIITVTFFAQADHRLTSPVICTEKTRSNSALLAINDKIAEDINDCPTALVLLIRGFISIGSTATTKKSCCH